jgi:arginine utilization regulatory protein
MFKELLENMTEGVLIFSKGGGITWCNRSAARTFQSKQHLIESKIKGCLPDNLKVGDCHFLIGGQEKLLYVSDILVLDNGFTAIVFKEQIQQLSETDQQKSLPSKDINKCNCYKFEKIQGKNRVFCETISMARKAANTLSPILIFGETGTGKELFAQSIHNASERCNHPFVAINCAAIPETLLEGILFGTVRGAFTEAIDRPGLFEEASKGTIFLDEINSMPVALQAKLLRVVQEKTIRRVGGVKDIHVDPRFISSSNVEPYDAVTQGMLRSDLFYRLGVVCLEIPPLRKRKDDIFLLALYFIDKACKKLEKSEKSLSIEVIKLLEQNDWPGNVRQFENAIECAVNFADDESEITLSHFPRHLRLVSTNYVEHKTTNIDNNISLKNEMDRAEIIKVITILEQMNGSVSQAAKKLGISRQSLYYRMKKYSINIRRNIV